VYPKNRENLDFMTDVMKVNLAELELIRAMYRNSSARVDEVIVHLLDVEIRRRKLSGAKRKHSTETQKVRNAVAAKKCRERKRLKKALAADRKNNQRSRH